MYSYCAENELAAELHLVIAVFRLKLLNSDSPVVVFHRKLLNSDSPVGVFHLKLLNSDSPVVVFI